MHANKYCRQAYNEAYKESQERKVDISTLWDGHNYYYSMKTGNSGLRLHLDSYHHEMYIDLSIKGSWANQLPSQKDLVKVAHQQAEMAALVQARPCYSKEVFYEHLVAFIIADDQVISILLNDSM